MAAINYGVTFNGRTIVHPGAYGAVDATEMVINSQGNIGLPVVIGQSDAGQSGKVLWFASQNAAEAYLKGGDILTATELMFSPSPEGGGGASTVGVIIANQNTPAALTVGALTLTALEYGAGGNRIDAALETGSIPGTKKAIITRWDTQQSETYDNLGAVLTIQYTGADAYAELDVVQANGVAETLNIKAGADAGTATTLVTVDLTDSRYATVALLAQKLASTPGLSIGYVDYTSLNTPVSALDVLTGVQIKGTASYLMAVNGDIETQINTKSQLVNVSIAAGTSVLNFTTAYLVGGVTGTVPADWSPAMSLLSTTFADTVVVLSSDSAVHQQVLSQVENAETRGTYQIMYTGGALGESSQQTKQRAATLNSSRAVLAWPGIYYPSMTSPLAPYFTAAMIAGRVCGVDPAEPVTFDYFNVSKLEVDLIAGDPTIDDLITSGVSVLERAGNGGIRLVQGITTYISANNPLYREISVRREADDLSNTMRTTMEDTFVGKKGVTATVSSILTKAIDVLEQAVTNQEIVAYKNVTVSFQGTVVVINYQVAPVEPINFILVTSHFVPSTTTTITAGNS